MEITACVIVGLYLLAAFYALAESLSNRHVYTATWTAKAQLAWEAVAWPAEALSLELPPFFSRMRRKASAAWSAVPVRYSEVPW